MLKFLPILFGFFALNVPSGLGVYWVTNTLVTTASNVAIKAQVTRVSSCARGVGRVGLFLCPSVVQTMCPAAVWQVASEMESSGMSVTPAPAPPRAAPPKSFADMVADAELVDSSAVRPPPPPYLAATLPCALYALLLCSPSLTWCVLPQGGEFVAVSDESAALKQVEGFGAATDDEDGPFGGGKRKNAKKKKKKGGKK